MDQFVNSLHPYHIWLLKQLYDGKLNAVTLGIKMVTPYNLIEAKYDKLKLLAHNKKVSFKGLLKLQKALRPVLMPEPIPLERIEPPPPPPPPVTLRCGSHRLTKALNQFLPLANTIQLLGGRKVGKSQLAYSMALESALHSDAQQKVVFIDSDLSFSHERISEIIKHKYADKSPGEIQAALAKLRVFRIFKLKKLFAFLRTLLVEQQKPNSPPVLVIIDSMNFVLFSTEYISAGWTKQIRLKRKLRIIEEFHQALETLGAQPNITVVFTFVVITKNLIPFEKWLHPKLTIMLTKDRPNASQIKAHFINRTGDQPPEPDNDILFQIGKTGVE